MIINQLRNQYCRQQKSKEDLLKEIKLKKTWTNPGNLNQPFAPFDVLKPKVLNYWEQDRVNMPERSYEKYPVNKAFKLDSKSKGSFGFSQDPSQYSEQYRIYLENHNKKFRHFVERPSCYEKKEKFLPQLLDYKPPFKIKKSEFAEFKQLPHNTFIYENRFRMNNIS